MNLWKLKRGQCVDVETRTFTNDFDDILGQLFEEVGKELPKTVEVCGEPIDDFAAWVEGQKPEWDRYEYDSAMVAIERGLMPENAYRDEHGVGGAPYWWKRFDDVTQRQLQRSGLDRYVGNLAKEIRDPQRIETAAFQGRNLIPPLIKIEGAPADGRHRTWAAIKLKRKTVPVINVTQANQARPDFPDFADRYMITTARGGRVYDYASMLDLALRRARKSPLPGMRQTDPKQIRSLVVETLHDEAFMRPLYGTVPARVSEAVEERVWERLRGLGR